MKGFKSALVIIDVQNDFCPGGLLAVREGDEVVPVLNQYIGLFTAAGLPVYATRDWHPGKTVHFIEYGGKWPPHCVRGTSGADFHRDLVLPNGAVIITKGDREDEDSYSGFDGRDSKGRPFEEALRAEGIEHLYAGGLATDYCVRSTVLDALKKGFGVTLLLDAIKGVERASGDSERAIDDMIENGADVKLKDEVVLV